MGGNPFTCWLPVVILSGDGDQEEMVCEDGVIYSLSSWRWWYSSSSNNIGSIFVDTWLSMSFKYILFDPCKIIFYKWNWDLLKIVA